MTTSFFPEITLPYYIAAPSWTHKSSGVRVLHLLVHALNEYGQKAFLIPLNSGPFCRNPYLNTPLLDVDYENFYNHAEIHPIAVYPDIVIGNPYNCKKVVRYLLAEPAKKVSESFALTDKVFYYRSDMGSPTLCLPTFDSSIFYPPEKYYREHKYEAFGKTRDGVGAYEIRLGTCFYSCKYEAFGNKLLPITDNSARLEGTHNQIADILRKSEKVYLYEHSEIAVLAKMCGCPVEEVKTDYWQGTDENWHFAKGTPAGWGLMFRTELCSFVAETQRWE